MKHLAKILFAIVLCQWSFLLRAQTTADELPIIVKSNKTFSGQLFGFGRDIVVEGQVDSDVGAIFANVRIDGQVNGSVSVLRGTIELTQTAVVQGDIVSVGGTIILHPEAQVSGQTIRLLSSKEGSLLTPRLGNKAQAALFFARTLLVFMVVIGLFYLFPTQVRQASFDLAQDIPRATLMGIVALAAFGTSLFLSFLLMVVAIGVPLFILFGCMVTLCALFGQVIVYVWLSRGVLAMTAQKISTVSAVFVVVMLVSIASELPILGILIQSLILVLGTGIVILTRFGTNKAWFTRKTRFWSAS